MITKGEILCPHCQKKVGFTLAIPDPPPVNICSVTGCGKVALDPWPHRSVCAQHDLGR